MCYKRIFVLLCYICYFGGRGGRKKMCCEKVGKIVLVGDKKEFGGRSEGVRRA